MINYMKNEKELFKILKIDNFISEEKCNYLINIVENSNLWESGGTDFWNNRVINYTKLLSFEKSAANIMLESNIECGLLIKKEYGFIDSIYSDTLQIVRWFPGMHQPPHADDMKNAGVIGFDHRVFGSIIYLNDNYEGGKTYYPNFNFEVSPKKGSLIVHPGDENHLHGVSKIEKNMRYTIASFWTFNKEKSHDWKSYK